MLILRTLLGLILVLLPTLARAQTTKFDAPPQHGLVLWLDAQASSTVKLVNGHDVQTWHDRSPVGNHASGTSAPAPPTFDSAAINGRPAVRFSGSSWLDTGPLADRPGQVTLFVVFARPGELASDDKWQRIVSCWDGQSKGDNKSPSFEISTPEGSAIKPTIYTEQLSGRHRGSLRIGAGMQYGSNRLRGLIAEVLIYDRGFLVDEQIQEVKAYLRSKWDIPQDPDASWTRIGQLPDAPQRIHDRLPLSDQRNAGKWTPFMPLWDEFTGQRLDRSKWWDHNPTWYGRAPARFLGEGQNVRVSDGMLHLVMKYDPSLPEVRFSKSGELYKDYSSASVKAKKLVRYGYFEICSRAMDSAGSSAFWFSSRVRDKRSGKPYRSEIDVFEIGGKAPGHEHAYHMNAHIFETPADGARHWNKGGTWEAPFRLADDFHVFGLLWTPDQLVYYVDGAPVRRMPNTHWKAPQHLIFDSETMGSWLGLPRNEDLPSTFSIQYVRAWKNAETDIPWDEQFEAHRDRESATPITRYVRSMDSHGKREETITAEFSAVGRQPAVAPARVNELPFAPPQDIAQGNVSGVTSLVAGDLNGDHRADVIVIEGGKHAKGRTVFAWFQAPDTSGGVWQRHDFPIAVPLRPFLGAARLADMDGDDDLDLVVSSDMHSGPKKEADLYIFRNPRPDADAEATADWQAVRINAETLSLHHINDMQIADMDGDGRLDVVCRSLEPNQIHIFFRNKSSSFDHRAIDTGIERSEGLAVGRLDDDLLPDIAFTGVWLKAPKIPGINRTRGGRSTRGTPA